MSEPQLPAVHEAWLPREHSLYRPRHGGRQLLALICAAVFLAVPALLWVVGLRPAQIENRELAAFPSPREGWGMFTALPQWANDQLIFRGAAIDAADGISRGVFREPPPLGTNGSSDGPLPNDEPAEEAPEKEKKAQDDPGSRQVIEGAGGWLYLHQDAQAKCSPARKPAQTIQLLQRMRKAVEASGRKFVLLVPPDKSTMVPQHLPESYSDKECAAKKSAAFWSQVIDTAGAVDLRPGLTTMSESLGKELYTPKDTHWSDEGSVLMAKHLAETVHRGKTASWRVHPLRKYESTADLPLLLGKNEKKTTTAYALNPDGKTDRVGGTPKNIEKPVRHRADPLPGTTDERTIIFGDSFTLTSARYLKAAFTDLTMYSSNAAGGNSDATIKKIVDSEVVVIEMVERTVAEGATGFVSEPFVKRLKQQLADAPKPK